MFAAVPFSDNGATNAGRVFAMDGDTLTADPGSALYEIQPPGGPQLDARFGFFISSPGDLVGNGVPDLVVGADGQDVGGNMDQGKAWVFDGADAALLQRLDLPTPECDQGVSDTDPGPALGWTTSAPGDPDGNGQPDYVAGGPHTNVDMNGTRQEDAGSLVSFNSGLADNVDDCSTD